MVQSRLPSEAAVEQPELRRGQCQTRGQVSIRFDRAENPRADWPISQPARQPETAEARRFDYSRIDGSGRCRLEAFRQAVPWRHRVLSHRPRIPWRGNNSRILRSGGREAAEVDFLIGVRG